MVVMTEKMGLVQVSVHAQERAKERFRAEDGKFRKLLRRVMDKGTYQIDVRDRSVKITKGYYRVICTRLESGHYFVKTITDKRTTRKRMNPNGKRAYSN